SIGGNFMCIVTVTDYSNIEMIKSIRGNPQWKTTVTIQDIENLHAAPPYSTYILSSGNRANQFTIYYRNKDLAVRRDVFTLQEHSWSYTQSFDVKASNLNQLLEYILQPHPTSINLSNS
ncbi:MAG TPA: hypothetical protein VHA52_10355, partial [Candidatus Babeliaceae bacterium]|nr:hypothetical protein [Candidatus Babeliaceae bacterium]